jgi:hypothetical protein
MKLRTIVRAIALVLGSFSLYDRSGLVETRGASEVTLVRVPRGGIQPELVQEDRGLLHMIYLAGEASAGDLFYVRSTDVGSTFSAPVRVNSQNGSAIATGTIRGGQIAVGRGGRVHVAWIGSEHAIPKGPEHPLLGRPTAPMLYARSNEASTVFEPQRNLSQRSYGVDGGSIAADGVGNVYVAWHGLPLDEAVDDESARRVWLARSADDGRTFGLEVPAWSRATGACECCGLRLFAAPDGLLYALYRSATNLVNRDIYLLQSTDRGQSFRGSRVHEWHIAACPMSSMSMTAPGARVFAAWETAGQVYFGVVDPAGLGVSSPVGAPSPTANRKHPRIVANGRGEILLVWTEGTAWMRGGAVAWQIFDSNLRPVGPTGRLAGVPVWSFAAAAARPDGTFVIFY